MRPERNLVDFLNKLNNNSVEKEKGASREGSIGFLFRISVEIKRKGGGGLQRGF